MAKLIALALLISANSFAMGAKPAQQQAMDLGIRVIQANAGTLGGTPDHCSIVVNRVQSEPSIIWDNVAAVETSFPELWTQSASGALVYDGQIQGESQTWTLQFDPTSLRLKSVQVVLKDFFHQEIHTCNL